jgi:O-antigen/teichoic acid export membrane protein
MSRSTALPAVPSKAPSAATVARASALNLFARVASGAAALAIAVMTTNLLDTHGRGIYAILTTWIGIGASMLTGGTTVLAADLIFGRQDHRRLHGASLAVATAAALLLLPLSLVVSLFTSSATPAALVCAATVTVLVTYSNFAMSIDQARGDVLRVSLTTVGMAVFPLLAMAASAAVFDPTVTTLIAAWAVGALMTASVQIALAVATGSLWVRHACGLGASIIRRALGVSVANGTMLLWSRIDVLVVAAVLSASAAGVYSIPVALSGSLLLLSGSLLTAMYHSIMTAPATEVAGRLSAALRHSLIVVLAGGGLSVPLVAVAAGFVFGDAYSEIWRPYAILVLGSACLCEAEILRHFLLTRLERSRELVVLALIMLAVNGALAAGGAAWFGLVGAAVATTVSYAAAAFALAALCARALSVSVRELAAPRRSDLASYLRVARSLLGGRR